MVMELRAETKKMRRNRAIGDHLRALLPSVRPSNFAIATDFWFYLLKDNPDIQHR